MSNGLGGEFAAYSLAWSDEFDGAAGSPPDPASGGRRPAATGGETRNCSLTPTPPPTRRWMVRVIWPSWCGGRIRRRTARRLGGRAYTSARLISKDRVSFRYGLVEARIKIPCARGVWPGFWMLGQDFDRIGWPGCGEIDVMEYFGTGRPVVQGALHGPGYSGGLGIAASRRMGSVAGEGFLRLFPQLGAWPDPLVRGRQALPLRHTRRPARETVGLRS